MKEYTRKEIEDLINENRRLSIENSSMKKMLSSKRFLMAEKIANTVNAIVPEGSLGRKTIKYMAHPLSKISRRKVRKVVGRITKLSKGKKKLIVIQSIVWNAPLKQRPHHLAKCLASEKDILVVYFEPSEQLRSFRKVTHNLVTVNSWDVIREIGGLVKNSYFFFNNVFDVSWDRIEGVKESGYRLVYEYIDEFHEDVAGSLVNQLYVWDNLPKLKPVLVLASAIKLYEEAKLHFVDSKVLLSRNAVNVEDFNYHLFEKKRIPRDMVSIVEERKPIVGYYGALAHWLDYDLISDFAINNPDIELVLLGVNYQHALSKLRCNLSNVHYLGPKKYNELPLYSVNFDCAIIPFQCGQIAKGTSPVKLFEYMAMGLPTVGTKDLIECRGYKYVYLANSAKDFSEKVRLCIDEHKRDEVRECLLMQARENSWQMRAKDILECLE